MKKRTYSNLVNAWWERDVKSFSNHNYLFSSLTLTIPADFLLIKYGFNMLLKYSLIEWKGMWWQSDQCASKYCVLTPALTLCPCHAITTKFTPKCTKPIGLQHFVRIFVMSGVVKRNRVHMKHFSNSVLDIKRCDVAFGWPKNVDFCCKRV